MTYFAATNALFSAYVEADFFGKCIFCALFALSIACWIILIHKGLQVKKAKHLCHSFEKGFEKSHSHLLSLTIDPKKDTHPFGEVFQSLKQKSTEILNKNHYFASEKETVYLTQSDLDLLESHVLITISSEAKKLEKNLFMLSTIMTLAPFLGLLGTVWGILVTFSGLQGGASATSNSAILGGLSTALVTTVLGLLIAIPALISYNWLKNSAKYLTSDMEDFLYKLLSTIELQYRKPL
jgi:biopolymer transport protein TolQ